MVAIQNSVIVRIPEDVKVGVKGRTVTVEGKRGKLTKEFNHAQCDIAMVEANKLRVSVYFAKKRQVQVVNTICSTINNMVKGVEKGFRYVMRLVYAHYPINVVIAADGKSMEVRNYIGQKYTRKLEIPESVKVYLTKVKDELIVEGNDLNLVSMVSSQINQSARVKDRDIRMFLDGIYVHQKTTIDK